MKAEDLIKRKTRPKILMYGSAGSGKTALVSQASRGYLMDFDNKMQTINSLKDQFTPLRQEIEFDTYTEKNIQKPDAWLKAKKKLLDIMNKTFRGEWEYDCLVIDSLSGLAEVVQNQIMAQCGKPMGKPEIREWGLIVAEVEVAIKIIKSLPILILITAHELPIQIDDHYVMKILAPGTKLPARIPTWFDEVWHTKTRSAAGGALKYIVSGRKTPSIDATSTGGMTKDFDHTTVGLKGVLSEIGFAY